MYWGNLLRKTKMKFGATVHYIDEGIDTGQVILKKNIIIKKQIVK